MLAKYALIPLVIVGLTALSAAFWYRSAAATARVEITRLAAERDTVVAINAEKAKEIERLTRQAAINNQIMADIHVELQQLNTTAQEQSKQLADLESSDPNVKNFLDLPLPDNFKRLRGR